MLYYQFTGLIVGKAVYDSVILNFHFTRSFYKQILSLPVEFKDMEDFDPDMYKSLLWMVENNINGADGFNGLTFTTNVVEFGTVKSVELKENGASIPVTNANKKEYVQRLIEYKLTTCIKPQIDAFVNGFNEIIPASFISIFNEQELELLISGMPKIDLDDWRRNCEYYGGYTMKSPHIQWFWQAVQSFNSEMQAKLLQFVTGSSKVPLDGFRMLRRNGVQKFQIHLARRPDLLPTAHTCYNHLDLPEYETYEILRQKLVLAIEEGGNGFGFI